MTYIPDNRPETIAASLRRVIDEREFERNAVDAARRLYGPAAVSVALDSLVREVVSRARGSVATNVTEIGYPANSGDRNK